MAFKQTSAIPAQYDIHPGFWLAFETAGTSITIKMATDSTGGTQLSRAEVDSEGYFVTVANARFIPHIDRNYKVSLYPTEADAIAKTNSEWTIDNLEAINASADQIFDSVATALLADLSGVDRVETASYYAGWEDTSVGPRGGAVYHTDGTTGTVSTVYSDRSGFFDLNGDGFALEGLTTGFIEAESFGFGVAQTVATNDTSLSGMKTAIPTGTVIRFGSGTFNITKFSWPVKEWHWEGAGKQTGGTRIEGDGTIAGTVVSMVVAQLALNSSVKNMAIQAQSGDIAMQVGVADGHCHLDNLFLNPDQGVTPTKGQVGLSVVDGNTSTFNNITAYGSNVGVEIVPGGSGRVFTNRFETVIAATNNDTGTAWNVSIASGGITDACIFINCVANGGNKALIVTSGVLRSTFINFWEEGLSGTSPVSLLSADDTSSVFIHCANWRSTGGTGSTVDYGISDGVVNSNDATAIIVNQVNRDMTVLRNLTVNTTLDVKNFIKMPDGITAPPLEAGLTLFYVDNANERFKVRYDDGETHQYQERNGQTNGALADKTSQVNTVDKQEGNMVFDVVNNVPAWAAGSADVDVWLLATGVTHITPV